MAWVPPEVTENRTYTEADLAAKQKEWERERAQIELIKDVSEIKGQISAMPAVMEQTARRVIAEVQLVQAQQNAEQRAQRDEQRSERAWERAPVFLQFAQLVVPIVAIILVYLIGKGRI